MPPDELGAVVHGPVILARANGIVAGLRCVFGHSGGLLLPVVLRATGVQAEAAFRQTSSRRGSMTRAGTTDSGQAPSQSLPQVHVEVNERSGIAESSSSTRSASKDAFEMQAHYWIGELPRDRHVRISVAWPQAGLPQSQIVITLDDLEDLPDRVLPLL